MRSFWPTLVAAALAVSGAVQIWFSYGEHEDALLRIQREKAAAAAAAIEQFIAGIEGQLGWTTHASVYTGPGGSEQRRFDFFRLLRQVPPITELIYIDGAGKEQLRISAYRHGRGRQRHRPFERGRVHRRKGRGGLARPGLLSSANPNPT